MKHLIFLSTFFILLSSCSSKPKEPTIIGSWVKPIKYSIDAVEGVILKADSTVSSINLDVNYLSWKHEGQNIILNKRTQNDTLTIIKLSEKELVFSKKGIDYKYFKISDSLAYKATCPIEIIVDTLALNLK